MATLKSSPSKWISTRKAVPIRETHQELRLDRGVPARCRGVTELQCVRGLMEATGAIVVSQSPTIERPQQKTGGMARCRRWWRAKATDSGDHW